MRCIHLHEFGLLQKGAIQAVKIEVVRSRSASFRKFHEVFKVSDLLFFEQFAIRINQLNAHRIRLLFRSFHDEHIRCRVWIDRKGLIRRSHCSCARLCGWHRPVRLNEAVIDSISRSRTSPDHRFTNRIGHVADIGIQGSCVLYLFARKEFKVLLVQRVLPAHRDQLVQQALLVLRAHRVFKVLPALQGQMEPTVWELPLPLTTAMALLL